MEIRVTPQLGQKIVKQLGPKQAKQLGVASWMFAVEKSVD